MESGTSADRFLRARLDHMLWLKKFKFSKLFVLLRVVFYVVNNRFFNGEFWPIVYDIAWATILIFQLLSIKEVVPRLRSFVTDGSIFDYCIDQFAAFVCIEAFRDECGQPERSFQGDANDSTFPVFENAIEFSKKMMISMNYF